MSEDLNERIRREEHTALAGQVRVRRCGVGWCFRMGGWRRWQVTVLLSAQANRRGKDNTLTPTNHSLRTTQL